MATTPKPRITPTGRPFWDGLAAGEIRLQQCRSCEKWVFYPRTICPHCSSRELDWKRASGRASLYTYTVEDAPISRDRAGLPPAIFAIVELDEGVRMATTLVGMGVDDPQVGMPLSPVFDNETFDDVTLLRFGPKA